MDLYSVDVVAELLNNSTKTVRRMVKRGQLQAVYKGSGKRGRPSLMITASSYGKYILSKGEKNYGRKKDT